MSRPRYFEVSTRFTPFEILLLTDRLCGKRLLNNEGLSSGENPLFLDGFATTENQFTLKVYEVSNGNIKPSSSRHLEGRICDRGSYREVSFLYSEDNHSHISWFLFPLFPVALVAFLLAVSGDGQPVIWLLLAAFTALVIAFFARRASASGIVPLEADRLAQIFSRVLESDDVSLKTGNDGLV